MAQLQALAAQRATAAARVRRLHELVSLLESVSSADAPAQANLVTRDGPVEHELERMRVLLARVGDRVTNLPMPKPKTNTRSSTMTVSIDVDVDDVKDAETVGQQRAQALPGLL